MTAVSSKFLHYILYFGKNACPIKFYSYSYYLVINAHLISFSQICLIELFMFSSLVLLCNAGCAYVSIV